MRRVVVIAAPALGYVVSLVHPGLEIGDDTRLFTSVHFALLVVVCLLAWMLILLVDGIDGWAATAARVLVVPFAVAYTAFTAFGGVAIGAFVAETNDLPADKQQDAAVLIHSVSHGGLAHPLYLVASLLWLASVIAVVLALWRERWAPRPALILVAVGGAAFARSHTRPWGPGGMAAVLAGVIWIELARRSAERNAAASPSD